VLPRSKITKISVIVPIYKCEKYIAKCLESILAQTFDNFEVVCVNDCTPDNSVAIVEGYIRRDARIRLIHHDQNLGLGGARNTGIKEAQADFIASVDSDDTVHPQMLACLWEACENGFFDIVVCGFDRVDEEGTVLSTHHSGNERLINEGNIDIFNAMEPAFWNKLWRKSLYVDNDIWFPNHLYYQDTATTPRILTKSRHVRYIPESLYSYLVRPNSISTTASSKHLTDYFKVFDVLLDFLEKEGIEGQHFDNFLDYVDRSIAHHATIGAQHGLEEEEQAQYLRHLLAFKTGYIENRRLVANKSSSELVPLLQHVRTKSDLLPPDRHPVLPLSVVVRTFLRPAFLARFLMSIGRYEYSLGVRFAEVLVGDDSPKVDVAANARAISKTKDLFPNLNVHHHIFEENIGISDCRNRLVQAACEDHVLICDDEFMLDEEADIPAALSIVRDGEYQLVGGWLKGNYDTKTGSFSYWGVSGQFSEAQDELIINTNEMPIELDDLLPSNYLLNFYVADRQSLLANPWNKDVNLEECPEFFYRFKNMGFKAALFGGLFARHTVDRGDDPLRFRRENWDKSLLSSPLAIDKKRSTVNRVRSTSFERRVVDTEKRTTVQSAVPLHEPVLGQAIQVTRISPEYTQHFGGYYDIRLVSDDSRYVLIQSAPATDRLPLPRDFAEIALVDTQNANKVRIFGKTSTWCHQQGAHAQFVPGPSNTIVYNIFDEQAGVFASCETDIKTGEQRQLSRPISALSPDGVTAASLNFSRLYDYRPGYGYPHIPDPFADENAPKGDGLWLFDLRSGEAELVLSYDAMRDFLLENGFEDAAEGKLILNHVAFNTDGTKILLLLRVFSEDAPFPTFTLVCNSDGSNLRQIFGFASHYHWKDADTVMLSGGEAMSREAVGAPKVFEVNVETGNFEQIGPEILQDDGHCSYSPDREYMLYDSYGDMAFPYRQLLIFRFGDEKSLTLGFFYSPPKWYNGNSDLRADLHPRWSPDGKTITFDSIHEGFRGVYSINTEEAIAAMNQGISRFEAQDFAVWYAKKYGSQPQSDGAERAEALSADASLMPGAVPTLIEHDVDRLWLLSLVQERRAKQSIFAFRRVPYVDGNTTLAELVHIARKHLIEIKSPKSFGDAQYLAANPDVAAAIEEGQIVSAYEHYVLHGYTENGRSRATL